jgi:toxin ParE1/3/4
MSDIEISFGKSALSDLQSILEWYTDEGVPDVGERFVADVFERVETLARHPDFGRVVPEFGQSFLREIIHPPFRIVYRRDSQRVRVVRIWRAERLLRLPRDEPRNGS